MNYLVCNYLGDGTSVPSNIRECRADDENRPDGVCGTELWVSVLMTPLVDAGQLIPICWICHVKMGGPFLRIHPEQMQMLIELGRVNDALAIVTEMNDTARDEVPGGMIHRMTDG